MSPRSWLRQPFARTPCTARRASARRLAVEALEDRRVPATLITVNTLTDPVNAVPGVTSLRDAITQADGEDGDTIQFSVTGTINLTKALPNLSSNLTIQGPGADSLTVQPGTANAFSILTVASGATVELSGLTLANGSDGEAGGGIDNEGTLTVTGCTLSGNIAGMGGGIYNEGTLTVAGTTLSGNIASYGGGIANGGLGKGGDGLGTLTMTNSTLSGNTADIDGAGLFSDGKTATVFNSTLTGNDADGSGGGILIFGVLGTTTTLYNTIVAGNSSGNRIGGSRDDVFGADVAAASSYNLIGNPASAGGLTDGTDGNIVGVAGTSPIPVATIFVTDANGAPLLADNGGPTATVALAQNSPALDKASTAVPNDPATDQRGALRGPAGLHAGAAPDIGAFEDSSAYLVTTTADSTAVGTLRAAVGWANVNVNVNPANLTPNTPAPNNVVFDKAGVFATPQTIALTTVGDSTNFGNSALAVTGTVVIDGSTASGLTVARSGAAGTPDLRIVYVDRRANLTLNDLTLSGGLDSSGNGGGGLFSNGGTVTLTGDTVSGNSAPGGFGGGLANVTGGTVTLTNDTFSNNAADDGGGLINHGTATLTNDTFTDNSANTGGGFDNAGGPATLTNDTFTNNSAGSGGGLFNDVTSTATLHNTIIAGNFTPGSSYSASPDEIAGTVTGSNNLIGDPNTAGGLTDGTDGNIVGVAGTSPIPLGTVFVTDTNGIPVLANYGGPTATVAIAPGSPAIDKASTSASNYPSTDQRGQPRVGPPDIGAFESQGFHLAISGGDGQVTPVGQPFGSALTVTVTANDPIGTLNNGTITFTAPGSGASATLSTTTATVVNGMASVTATANAIGGSYQVTAASTEANTVAFNLTNEDLPPTAGVSGPTQGLVDQVLTYTLTASDTSAFPTYTFVVNWGDNTSTSLAGASGVTVTHVYAAAQPSPPHELPHSGSRFGCLSLGCSWIE